MVSLTTCSPVLQRTESLWPRLECFCEHHTGSESLTTSLTFMGLGYLICSEMTLLWGLNTLMNVCGNTRHANSPSISPNISSRVLHLSASSDQQGMPADSKFLSAFPHLLLQPWAPEWLLGISLSLLIISRHADTFGRNIM